VNASLVITTFNRRDALELVLKSALVQSRLPVEIVVADDGSTDGTTDMLIALARQTPVPIIHSWQTNEGFRAARSRNLALAKTSGEYIVLLDGDIVLHSRFIEDHLAFARPGSFVQGSRALLDGAKTHRMIQEQQLTVSWFEPGVGNRKNCVRSRLLSCLASGATTKLQGIRTCNLAFWRKDGIAVNGFNEAFTGWGREDSDFAARLLHSGILRRNLRFRALGYHLHHPHHPRVQLAENDKLLAETINRQLVRCDNGLDQHLPG